MTQKHVNHKKTKHVNNKKHNFLKRIKRMKRQLTEWENICHLGL